MYNTLRERKRERERERERKSVRKGQDKLVFEVKTGKYFSLKLAI